MIMLIIIIVVMTITVCKAVHVDLPNLGQHMNDCTCRSWSPALCVRLWKSADRICCCMIFSMVTAQKRTELGNAALYLRSLLSPLADTVVCTTVQVSHSSEEVLALKKEIARCQVEADKLRTAISMNKVCCCTHSWTRSIYPRGSLLPPSPSLAQMPPQSLQGRILDLATL